MISLAEQLEQLASTNCVYRIAAQLGVDADEVRTLARSLNIELGYQYHAWTPAETVKLFQLRDDGYPWKVIAQVTGHPWKSCQTRYFTLRGTENDPRIPAALQ